MTTEINIDPLLRPFTINGLRLRNRIVSTSHDPGFSEAGGIGERYIAYHVEKARGGVGLTQLGSCVVSSDSGDLYGSTVQLFKDETLDGLSRLAAGVENEGCAVTIQLTHLGRRTSGYSGEWLPVVFPSPTPEVNHRFTPKEMEDWDIERVIEDYAAGAAACKAAGIHGVEIESHGHLFDGFISPLTNQRGDEWGGSFENRQRFGLAVVDAIRSRVGRDYPLGIRMSVNERQAGGVTLDDSVRLIQSYAEHGVDYISSLSGQIGSDKQLADMIPALGTPSAPFLQEMGELRRRVDLPVIHAGRVQDIPTARHAITDGLVDLVGLTRAQIADPYLVRKLSSGQDARVRPCVGATYCLDSIHLTGDTKCIHNPAIGRETVLPHEIDEPAARSKRVVVVGGGPAGLECARVLGERGHSVVLCEANDRVGGQLLLASALPRRKELQGIIDWRVEECSRFDVDIRTNAYVSASDIRAENPDVVVIATGGIPSRECVEQGPHLVLDTWDVFTATKPFEGDVLVYDFFGNDAGLSAVEHLAAQPGTRIRYTTQHHAFGAGVGPLTTPYYFKAFDEHSVDVRLNLQLVAVTKGADGRLVARLKNEYSGRTVEEVYDHVVVEYGTLPNDETYFELRPQSSNRGEVDLKAYTELGPQEIVRNAEGDFQLYRIGDAVAGRNVHTAVLEGMRIALAI